MAKKAKRAKGLSGLYNNIIDNIWAAAAHIEHYVTTQMEKNMGTLSESVTELSTAIAREFDDIRAAAEATLASLREQLEAVGGENVELKDSLDEQVSVNEDLVQQITDAQQRIDALVAELGANDPAVDDGAHPDNTLPNEIPVEGEPDVINPLGRGGRK